MVSTNETIELNFERPPLNITLNQSTINKIQTLMEQRKQETQAIQKYFKEKEKKLHHCYQLLQQGEVSREVLKITYEGNMESLIIKLNNLLKKNDNLWELHKRIKKGITYYSLKPT